MSMAYRFASPGTGGSSEEGSYMPSAQKFPTGTLRKSVNAFSSCPEARLIHVVPNASRNIELKKKTTKRFLSRSYFLEELAA